MTKTPPPPLPTPKPTPTGTAGVTNDAPTRRKHTYNLANMNEAQNALLRATRLMAVLDHHLDAQERRSIEQAIDAELTLVNAMINYRHTPYPDR